MAISLLPIGPLNSWMYRRRPKSFFDVDQGESSFSQMLIQPDIERMCLSCEGKGSFQAGWHATVGCKECGGRGWLPIAGVLVYDEADNKYHEVV